MLSYTPHEINKIVNSMGLTAQEVEERKEDIRALIESLPRGLSAKAYEAICYFYSGVTFHHITSDGVFQRLLDRLTTHVHGLGDVLYSGMREEQLEEFLGRKVANTLKSSARFFNMLEDRPPEIDYKRPDVRFVDMFEGRFVHGEILLYRSQIKEPHRPKRVEVPIFRVLSLTYSDGATT